MLLKSECDEIIALTCPHCQRGLVARQRADTKEFVHDTGVRGSFSQTLCWATGFRNSRFVTQAVDNVKASEDVG